MLYNQYKSNNQIILEHRLSNPILYYIMQLFKYNIRLIKILSFNYQLIKQLLFYLSINSHSKHKSCVNNIVLTILQITFLNPYPTFYSLNHQHNYLLLLNISQMLFYEIICLFIQQVLLLQDILNTYLDYFKCSYRYLIKYFLKKMINNFIMR